MALDIQSLALTPDVLKPDEASLMIGRDVGNRVVRSYLAASFMNDIRPTDYGGGNRPLRFLDLGSGTGVMSIAAVEAAAKLLSELEDPKDASTTIPIEVVAVDLNPNAVKSTADNYENHLPTEGVTTHVYDGDWNDPKLLEKLMKKFPYDGVLCNPPYFSGDIETPEAYKQTDRRALYAATDSTGIADRKGVTEQYVELIIKSMGLVGVWATLGFRLPFPERHDQSDRIGTDIIHQLYRHNKFVSSFGHRITSFMTYAYDPNLFMNDGRHAHSMTIGLYPVDYPWYIGGCQDDPGVSRLFSGKGRMNPGSYADVLQSARRVARCSEPLFYRGHRFM